MKTNFFLVNVSDANYYEDCHIRGSINVPLDEIDEWAKDIEADAHIVVYCASYRCPMALTAWMKLHEQGFEHVWVYEGGTNEWYHMNMPVEGPCRQPYLVDMMHQAPKDDVGMEQEIAMIPGAVQKVGIEELKKMIANSLH